MKTTPLLLPLLALLLFSTSCRQETSETDTDPAAVQGGAKPEPAAIQGGATPEPAAVPADKLQNRAGVIYIVNDQDPFKGKAQDYYPNGQLKWEAVIRDGYVRELNRWHENGVKELTCSFTKGTLNEVMTDALDLLVTKHDILEGRFTSYDEEARQEVNGEFSKEKKVSEHQDMEGYIGGFSGSIQDRHTNGNMWIEVTIRDGYVKELNRWHENGVKELTCEFNSATFIEATVHPLSLLRTNPSKLDGKFILFDSEGQPIISADFRGGQRQTLLRSIGGERVPFKLELGMVTIPAGHFLMGSLPTERGRSRSENLHHVTISRDYFLGKTEVTWAQWKTVTEWASIFEYTDLPSGQRGSHGNQRGTDQDPVTKVNWYDAVKWLNALSELKGLQPVYRVDGSVYRTGEHSPTIDLNANGYRLPTEAEWEYAARGGPHGRGTIYAGSNNLDEVAWYIDNSRGQTHSVGGKKANELGLYDMSGNVLEWVNDWSGNYSSGYVTDPKGATSGSRRLSRGGSWRASDLSTRNASRYGSTPHDPYNFIGFRPARSSVP